MLTAAIVFVVVMVIGLPITFASGLMGTVHMLFLGNESYLLVIIQCLFDRVDLISLTCLPLFIMADKITNAGGVITRLLDSARKIVGRLKAGLVYCCVLIAVVLSATLGPSNGMVSTSCGILVLELWKDNYPEELTDSLVAVSLILGPIIPPPTSLIMHCMMTGASIQAMSVGEILPGILLVIVSCIVIPILIWKMEPKRATDHLSLKRLVKTFFKALPALLAPVVTIDGAIGSLFTAIEAGVVSCLCALIASTIYCGMDWEKLPGIMPCSTVTGGGILLMILFGGVAAWSLTRAGIPTQIIAAITSITNSRYLIIALIIVALMTAGCLLDTGIVTMVMSPVMFPLATAIGMDAVHFGLVFYILITIGYITSSVGMVLFVTSNASGIPFNKLCKMIWPFATGAFAVITVLTYLLDVVLWVPRLCGCAG